MGKSDQTHSVAREGGVYSPYHSRFFQGATLVPRSLWFVELVNPNIPSQSTPHVRTAREAKELAKAPWKVEVEGLIERQYLFGTVMARELLPFVVRKLSMVVLPVKVSSSNHLTVINAEEALSDGCVYAHDWFQNAEKIWNSRRKTESHTAFEWLNYDNKITNQPFGATYFVLFNQSEPIFLPLS